MTQWFSSLAQQSITLLVAALCYLPMGGCLRFSRRTTAALCAGTLLAYSVIAATVQTELHLTANLLLLPALAVCFPLYRMTLKTDLFCALAVYVSCCALETFPAHFANVLEFYLYPTTEEFSLAAALFQLALTLLLLAGLWPFRRRVAWAVEVLESRRVWLTVAAISTLYMAFSVASSWRVFDIIRSGASAYLFIIMQTCALGLLLCVYVLFYQAVRRMMDRAQLEQREQLLEMQSHQYQTLQEHMEQTARLRHDFRHSVRLLSDMAGRGDLEGIRAYLTQYEETLTDTVSVNYCSNATLNALFRYYHEMAVSAGINIAWKAELPNPLTVSELDLASLFGNILENGIEGCLTLPEEKRYFNLTAEPRHGNSLYIVSTNSFDGRVKKGKTGYRSTKRSGTGIGLAAIAAVAEKYDGVLQVSNSSREFFTDVVIKI